MKVKRLRKIGAIVLGLCLSAITMAQINVDVNLNVKHITGDASTFDRSKFIVLHAEIDDGEWPSAEHRRQMLEDYDVYLGRNNGGIVWEFDQLKEDPAKAGWPDLDHLKERAKNSMDNYKAKTDAHQFENKYGGMMIGGQPTPMFPNGQKTRPSPKSGQTGWAYEGYDAVAEYYANYLKEFYGTGGVNGRPKPAMLEVLNEPFVHAGDLNTTNRAISEMHSVVAKRVKALNPNVKVGGYTAAHPAFEASNFEHWNNNWKLFIDVSGADMDFFSVHLYDYGGKTVDFVETQRKGSNIEAIMDMMNHYSYLKLGEVKPLSISEYGWFGPGHDGQYTKQRDWYNIRSYSSMMMQLMERSDNIVNALPFMILKALWSKPPSEYGPRLFRQKKELGEIPGEEWVYTEFEKFFQLWANVKGTRIDTYSSEIDILSDAYVDGKKVYLILSNLEHSPQTVDLTMLGDNGNAVSEIFVKHVYANADGLPVLDSLYPSALSNFTLEKEATAIVEYTFADNVQIGETSEEQRVFAESYFKAISANVENKFQLNGLDLANNGEAMLRLGLGRNHGKSLSPVIKVNGHLVKTTGDWKGYDQNNRDSFFGVIDVPISYDYLKENNEISIKFSDAGGFVTSLNLQTFKFSKEIVRTKKYTNVNTTETTSIKMFPNPVKDQVNFKGLGNNNYRVRVYSSTGALVSVNQLSNSENSIRVEELPAGVYMFNIEGREINYTSKFIKIQ